MNKSTTVLETIPVTPEIVRSWLSPPFQPSSRYPAANRRVGMLVDVLHAEGGEWPGVIILGVLDGRVYVVDGQWRMQAFLASGLAKGMVTVQRIQFQSMEEMAKCFLEVSSPMPMRAPKKPKSVC